MKKEELKHLMNGTCLITNNGDLGIKIDNGILFPNEPYFDDWEMLDENEELNVIECVLITQKKYEIYKECRRTLAELNYEVDHWADHWAD